MSHDNLRSGQYNMSTFFGVDNNPKKYKFLREQHTIFMQGVVGWVGSNSNTLEYIKWQREEAYRKDDGFVENLTLFVELVTMEFTLERIKHKEGDEKQTALNARLRR